MEVKIHLSSHVDHAFLLCVSLSLQAWVSEIQEYANDDVVVMLLGNKSDMVSERVVKKEEAEKLAKVRKLL